MTLSVKQLMAAANEAVPKISVEEARQLVRTGKLGTIRKVYVEYPQ